jgi:hypothetical protein
MIIIIIMIIVGAASYLIVGNVASAMPIKAFVVKTLPKIGLFMKRILARMPALVSKAALKRYLRAFLGFCALNFLTDEILEWLENRAGKFKQYLQQFFNRFKTLWSDSSLGVQIVIVAIAVALLFTFPVILYMGAWIVPVTFLLLIANWVWNKLLLRAGAGILVQFLHDLLGQLLAPLIPDRIETKFVRYKERFAAWLSENGYKLAEKHKEWQLQKAKEKAKKVADTLQSNRPVVNKNDPPPTS